MTQILRQSTQIIVVIGPFVDVGDGFTPETGVTLSGADEAELLKSNTGTTTSISGNTWAAITGCDGYYALTLSTTDTNTVGAVTIMVNDDSVCLPVLARFQVIEEAAYDALYAASAPGYVANAPVNVAQFGGTNLTAASGIPEVKVASLAANAITATAIATDAITAGKIAADAIGASELAADAASEIGTAVWATATRVLTAGTNIALAKGTGVTGFNDLSAAAVNAEVDTALADYDAPTKAELDSGLAGLNDPTAAAVADAVWDEAKSGHTTAGTFGKSVADVEADTNELQADDYPTSIAAVKSDTAAILIDTAVIGAAGAGLTAIPWNAAWDAEVQSEATDALNAYDPPTKTEMDSGFSGLNDPTVAEIADGVWDEATSGHSSAGTTGKALTDAGGAGTPPSAADVADAVWDELLSGHTTTGSAGDTLGNVATGTPPSAAAIRAEIDSNSTQLAAIVADTNEIQAELADGGRTDLLIDAIKAKTDNIPGSPAAVGDIPTAGENADALLGRNIAGGSSTGRIVTEALQALRNKVAIVSGTATVFAEDDATPSWTATVTTDAAADPIITVDPA